MYNKKHHDCKEVVARVELMLDGELNAKDEQDLMCELQRCMHCLEHYNLQKRFKNFLKSRIERKTCCPNFLESLKQKIFSSRTKKN